MMKRWIIVAAVVATLICPVITACDSNGADVGKLPSAKLIFDNEKISIFNDSGTPIDSESFVELGDFIKMVPIYKNAKVFMNDREIQTTDSLFCMTREVIADGEIIIECIPIFTVSFDLIDNKIGAEAPEKIENLMLGDKITLPDYTISDSEFNWFIIQENENYCIPPGELMIDENIVKFSEDYCELILHGIWDYNLFTTHLKINHGSITSGIWTKIDEQNYCVEYSYISKNISLPNIDSHWYKLINWLDEDGNVVKEWNYELCKNVKLIANQKPIEFKVNFYDSLDINELVKTRMLSINNYQTPVVNSDDFIGWYYKDNNGVELEFKEGVVLIDDMNVYAKYLQTSSNNDDVEIIDLLTENGIKISDNEVVESVAASAIFVVLALGTFLFFFRRY